MKKQAKVWALVMAMTVFAAGPARAAENDALLKDMTSVIALLGLPCGKAVNVVRKGENDHLVTCQDGNRYRVFVNPAGRVVAEKQ